MWNPDHHVTIYRMMTPYKGEYSSLRHYKPTKSCKWKIKIWCLVDNVTKYVWSFQVYCGKNMIMPRDTKATKKGDVQIG